MDGGFLRHHGLLALSTLGAVAETGLLALLAPGARALGPQVTALPPLAAYHDLRWLFAFGQSWLAFVGVLVTMLVARAVLDAMLVLLAWPKAEPRPRFITAFWSCAVLTLLVWVLLSPVVTLMFGVALVPFSWPFLGAVPILLGCAIALSHGGVGRAWWRRLPAAGTTAWLLGGFVLMSAVAAVSPWLNVAEFLAVAALAGLLNARAWYGLAMTASRYPVPAQAPAWHWRAMLWQARRAMRRRTSWVPLAPVAALLVLVLVVWLARLAFTGTVHLAPSTAGAVAAGLVPAQGVGEAGAPQPQGGSGGDRSPRGYKSGLLVVAGWGSNCCNNANNLAADEPGMLVRQFSYLGLTKAGQPIPYGQAADLPITELGDRIATQVEWLHSRVHGPVNIVAESEGTLGLYAMLARHPGLPIGSVVLLSPIVEPGQVGQGGVPGEALITLNNLIGEMSPYGGSGAQQLIESVGEFGAKYFADTAHHRGLHWLAVVPLADAVTMPVCSYPQNLVVVQAFHGGLLGDPQVQQMVVDFLNGATVHADRGLRNAAQVIAAAASAWRMPDLHPACPAP